MKRSTCFAFAAFISLPLLGVVFGQGAAESDLQKLGKEFIPDGMEPAHKTVKVGFAESATWDGSEHIVVLWKPVSGLRRYDGAVVLSRRADSFDYRPLPQPESTWSMMEPIAIFAANADGDTENELFIIDECYTGIGPEGAKPFYRTRVYDWNGVAFTHVEPVSDKMGNVRTAASAKARLRRLSKTLTQKTEMQVWVDFVPHNQSIAKAATAGEAWAKDPAQIIARTFGGFSDTRSKTVEFVAPTADGADTLRVTITSDGLMDDSVRGEKIRLELKADNKGVWQFTAASKAWRCQPGRGRQDYSTTKCS
jgi:hypothetical protein